MHIKVLNMTTCFAMHRMTCPVLVFKTPEVLQLPSSTLPSSRGSGSSRPQQSRTATSQPIWLPSAHSRKLRRWGSTLYDDRSNPTGRLPTEGRQRRCSHQHLEHRTDTSFLPLKIWSYHFFHSTFAPTEHRGPNTFGPGHSGAPRGCTTTSLFFYFHMVNTLFFTQMKG